MILFKEEKKKFLNLYLEAKRDLIRLKEQLEELRFDKISMSRKNDGMPRGSYVSDLSGYAARMDELERKIIKARYERITVFEAVRDKIESLTEGVEKDLLTYRYLRGMKWEDISEEMGYSWKQVHRIHDKALEHLDYDME